MKQSSSNILPLTIGLDLGSRSTQVAVLAPSRKLIEERTVSTTKAALTRLFERYPGARIVLEASTPARWITKLAESLGHEVIVANPRNIPLITQSQRKNDRNDARLLAKLGQVDVSLLCPVQLRDERFQSARRELFVRDHLVKQRTKIVTFIRSQVKAIGRSLPSCDAKNFAKQMQPAIPRELQSVLNPLFQVLETIVESIKTADERIARLNKLVFPESEVLRAAHGVGPLTALAFVATIGDPARFRDSRSVGAYVGLVPAMNQSGNYDPAMRITKCGDGYLRRLLVSSATRILQSNAPDSDLKRFGERIIGQGGKRARARARIAVARKLAVLLHALLKTGEVLEPLRNSPDDEIHEAASETELLAV